MRRVIQKISIKTFLIISGIAALLYLSGQLGTGEFFNSHIAFGYGGGGGGYTPSIPLVSASNVPLSISSIQEGKLTQDFNDGTKTSLQVPQGAVGQQTTFETKRETLVSNQPTAGANIVDNKIFNITAKDAANILVRNFSSNLTIILTVPNLPSNTSKLGVYYFNETTNKWVKVAGATFDQTNKKVTFQINHFTIFAVIEVAGVPETLAISGAAAPAYPDGSLLKTAVDSKVYLIDNGQKRWIPTSEIFKANGYSWSSVKVVDASVLAQYTEGANVQKIATPTVPTATIPEGGLIRAKGDFDVYIVKYVGSKKFKRLILSPSVFNSYQHLKWSDVKDVDKSVVDSFTTSDLVRAVGDPKVYKLYPAGDAGEKRWIKTATAFTSRGFDWDAIYEINQVDRDSYQEGASLE